MIGEDTGPGYGAAFASKQAQQQPQQQQTQQPIAEIKIEPQTETILPPVVGLPSQ